ncbi:MAG: recombination protein RecR [Thermoleophilia bacterium]|nr:recombination protein RecR [Thermoleophilia bacterium]
MLPPSAEALVRELTRLPGVGRRSAQRLAVHLLRVPEADALNLAHVIEHARAHIHPCPECFGFAEDGLCPICRDTRRDESVICVVEAPQDVDPIERSGAFRGRYHVLGGALSPLDGVDPEDLTIAQLVQRVQQGGITEVILATNPTMTGEATAAYIAGLLRADAKITRLASGLPVGGDLEFADEVTLGRALDGRRVIE